MAELWRATLEGRADGLANRRFFAALGPELARCGALAGDPWSAPLFRAQAEGWGSDAPPLAPRWGEVNVYALTAHQIRGDPKGQGKRGFAAWWRALFLPCLAEAAPFYRGQVPVVFPIGGAHDSLFQVHREGFASYDEGLFALEADDPGGAGRLFLAPIDFGSQHLFAVELRAGERARARVLVALGGTELTAEIPGLGNAPQDAFRPTLDFAAQRWSDLVLDEERLERDPEVRSLVVERP